MSADTTNVRLLQGRIALVTGGVGSIGRAIAGRMAANGADIVVADLDEAASAAFASTVAEKYGVRTLGVGVNVTSEESMEAAADRIERELGVTDVVVANAGILSAKPAVELDLAQWQSVIAVNLTGAFITATVFARRLQAAQQPGSIIFSSSLFGLRGGRGNAAYSASKFGVIGLAQTMAAELACDGIRVNSVCPGQVESAMLGDLFTRRAAQNNTTESHERDVFVERIPAGRLGSADEIADTFVYLASDLSSYVTGHSLLVDGGWQVG